MRRSPSFPRTRLGEKLRRSVASATMGVNVLHARSFQYSSRRLGTTSCVSKDSKPGIRSPTRTRLRSERSADKGLHRLPERRNRAAPAAGACSALTVIVAVQNSGNVYKDSRFLTSLQQSPSAIRRSHPGGAETPLAHLVSWKRPGDPVIWDNRCAERLCTSRSPETEEGRWVSAQ